MRAINADLLESKYRLMYDAETENQVMAVADFTIDELETFDFAGKWIPCEKELPPLGVDVIVTIWGADLIICKEGETVEDAVKRVDNEVRYTTIAQYVRDRDLDGNEWMDWFGADGFPMIVKPVAWMPMPEPYMGVKNGN